MIDRRSWIAGAAAAYLQEGRTAERADHSARWLCDVTFGPAPAPSSAPGAMSDARLSMLEKIAEGFHPTSHVSWRCALVHLATDERQYLNAATEAFPALLSEVRALRRLRDTGDATREALAELLWVLERVRTEREFTIDDSIRATKAMDCARALASPSPAAAPATNERSEK